MTALKGNDLGLRLIRFSLSINECLSLASARAATAACLAAVAAGAAVFLLFLPLRCWLGACTCGDWYRRS